MSRAKLIDFIEHMGIPADQFMTWDQITVLAENGRVEFASHSMSHSNFANVSGEWLHWELEKSAELIREHTGANITSFVFPYGDTNEATCEVRKGLAGCGYENAFLTSPGTIGKNSDRSCMHRMKAEVEPRFFRLNSSPVMCNLVCDTFLLKLN